jgi:Metal-dependent amidase/aminoacylase/carboxypeptidase
MPVYAHIEELADRMTEKLVACRRDFHKYAESGWFEMRTASLIARRLTDMGYEVLAGRDVCRDESRMGLPPDEELQKNCLRAKEQGADSEFLEKVRGGFTGVMGILRCGKAPPWPSGSTSTPLGWWKTSPPITVHSGKASVP